MRSTVVVITIGREVLAGQLAALAEQTVMPEQIIVVNNGEAGAVTPLIEHWSSSLSTLELVEDNRIATPGYARNVGARHAREDALIFLDDDDIVDPRYVEAMNRALEVNPMVAARVDLHRLNPPTIAANWGVMQANEPMRFHDFLPWVVGGAMGIRRATFEAVGGFDERLQVSEDTDLCWRSQLKGFSPPAFEAEALVHFRLRARPKAAFIQAQTWAMAEVALYRRYRAAGFPPRRQLRQILRWLGPVRALLPWPGFERRVVAARKLGDRVGHLRGSIRERCLYL